MLETLACLKIMMRNFVYSGGLSGGLLRHIKNDFFSLFQNEVKSVLNIKESYSMKKKAEKMFKKIRIKFYKTKGGGSKAVYKLYKKNRRNGNGCLPLCIF